MAVAMDALVSAPPEMEIHSVYRCARCGVESPERTCFIVPERRDPAPHDIRCITCEHTRLSTGMVEGTLGLLRAIFVPVLALVMMQRGLGDLTVFTLMGACVMAPLLTASSSSATCGRMGKLPKLG